jgi:hypothetical protein
VLAAGRQPRDARQGCSCPLAVLRNRCTARPCIVTLCMKLIAIATLSVCIALLCLSQSESLSQFAQLELENTTCQTLPCPTQPSPSITLCAVGAINTVQAPGAVFKFIFARTRRSPLTLAAAQYARLRERGSTLCLCNTNHPAGPRIRKQDPWELEGHGQYVQPRLPPPQASISYATYGI